MGSAVQCCAIIIHLRMQLLESNSNFQVSSFPPSTANWMIVSHELEHIMFGGKAKKKKKSLIGNMGKQ